MSITKKRIVSACAKYDKEGKVIKGAIASCEWRRREMKKLGLDPDNHIDRAFFKEICE